MNFGYKTFLALTLATAACFRSKAQGAGLQKSDNLIEAVAPRTPPMHTDSATFENTLPPAEGEAQAVEENDTIYQSVLDIEHDAVRLIAHFESIKMNAYWDKVAKKWTIGFGNITHPDGRPIRRGDKIKDEAELMHYFRSYFREKVAPAIKKYLPTWDQFAKNEKLALLDLFWNAGSGQGVLFTKKENDAGWQRLPEKLKEDIARHLLEKNEKVSVDGISCSLADVPEWRNLDRGEKDIFGNMYFNNNIVKGDEFNRGYNEKLRFLDGERRTEISDLLKQQRDLKLKADMSAKAFLALTKTDFAAIAPKPLPLKMPSSQYREVNDSTISYMGFVASENYTYSDLPQWYKLDDRTRKEVCKRLADANRSIICKGVGIFDVSNVPAWYLLNNGDKIAMEKAFEENPEVLHRTALEPANSPVLTDLGCELNAYALNHNADMRERAASRIASFIRSRGKVVPALQKRANIRAKIFSGEIQLGGEGDNSIDLDKVSIGASYSLSVNDLNDTKLICDSINNCKYGKNFADTMEYQLTHAAKTPVKNNTRVRNKNIKRLQPRILARAGARGH